MAFWAFIPYIIQGISAIQQSNSASAQNANQQAWNRWNALANYDTAMTNIFSQTAITSINNSLTANVAYSKMQAIAAITDANVGLLTAAQEYNDQLYEEEILQTYKIADLDVALLHRERERERGTIVARQSASGTIIGEGSNADVIKDSMAEEALDAFVVQHQADIVANKISNARARSAWEADTEIRKTIFSGQMQIRETKMNAEAAILGAGAQQLFSNYANWASAELALTAGLAGANNTYNANQTTINNNLSSGLFSAGSGALSTYFNSKSSNTGSSLLS